MDYQFSEGDAAKAKAIAHQMLAGLPDNTRLDIQLTAVAAMAGAMIKLQPEHAREGLMGFFVHALHGMVNGEVH